MVSLGTNDSLAAHHYLGWTPISAIATEPWRALVEGGEAWRAHAVTAARAAVLRGDSEAAHTHLARIDRNTPADTALFHGCAAWVHWMDGAGESAAPHLEALRRLPERYVGCRVDGFMVRALFTMQEAPLEALQLARTASAEARAASLPHWEFLAGLVLARARRFCGQPLFAATILASLRQWLPALYAPWADWEAYLAGEAVDVDSAVYTRWHAFREDIAGMEELYGRQEGAFARGEVDATPRGVDAFLGPQGALVLGSIGTARRCVAPEEETPVTYDLRGLQKKRVATLACALAMTPSVTVDGLFRAIYGFAYHPGRHKGAFRVLLHRARKTLEDYHLTIEETKGQLAFAENGTIAIFDPRTVVYEDAAVLALLRRQNRLTTKEVMAALGIPRRTAQDALRRLVEQGILARTAAGAAAEYICEDTVYEDPTKARRQPS